MTAVARRRLGPLALLIASALCGGSAGAAPSVWAVDGRGRLIAIDEARASLQRTPPRAAPDDPGVADGDPDALRMLLAVADGQRPTSVVGRSRAESGEEIAEIDSLGLSDVPCPQPLSSHASGRRCAVTPPIRVVADAVDAAHPTSRDRSIRGTLAGALVLSSSSGQRFATIRVTGPRSTPAGEIERLRARARFVFVRLAPGGALPAGGDPAGAAAVASEALTRANALWGACGISFGPADQPLVELVDPPPAHLLSLGCGHGLPASGGAIDLLVGGRRLSTPIPAGTTPAQAARRVAASLRAAGYQVHISDNQRMAAGALGSSDLSVRTAAGELASLAALPNGRVSSDATLSACIGRVDLEDGLQHFDDVDAMVGTVEERALVMAYDDHDPSTIDVFIVPGFARGGRIGESFIGADGGALRNAVLVDRAALRSNEASFTLAHEIGHVLLDDPGHPDDYGADTPTQLMDADASDPSAYGPRRLSLPECARALRQSGPTSPVQLLTRWPLQPLGSGE